MNGQSRSIETSVLEARHKILNRLCSAYRRAVQDPDFDLRAYDVMVELAISRNVFAEALDGFADLRGELIVEMVERNGERYTPLGETPKYNAVIDRRCALGIIGISARQGEVLADEQIAQAWAKHYPNHRAEKVSEHVCRLICLCIDYRVIGEISGGDTTARLDRVLANMQIQKKSRRRMEHLRILKCSPLSLYGNREAEGLNFCQPEAQRRFERVSLRLGRLFGKKNL